MKKRILFVCCLLYTLTLSAQRGLFNKPYDLVIVNGRMMDPASELDGIRNIAISKGKIVKISTRPLRGRRTIDASGLVIAPGFIDLHSHLNVDKLGSRVCALDGITTAIDAEAGTSFVGAAYEQAAKEGRAINYGFSVAWATGARVAALCPYVYQLDGNYEQLTPATGCTEWAQSASDPVQEKVILAKVEKGLKEGGLAIALLLGHAPGSGHREVYELCKLAITYNVPINTEIRFAGHSDDRHTPFESLQELVSNALTTGTHYHLCDLATSVGGDFTRCLELIQLARSRGANITMEALSREMVTKSASDSIFNPAYRINTLKRTSTNDLLFYGSPINSWERLTEIRAQSPDDLITVLDINEVSQRTSAIIQRRTLMVPGITLATGAQAFYMPDGNRVSSEAWPLPTHAFSSPRSLGSYAYAIEHYVNQDSIISLMELIKMAAYLPAKYLESHVPAMRFKGRLQEGADADMVIFNAMAVKNTATPQLPASAPVGFQYVLVNGIPVLFQGQLDPNVLPGQPVRRPVVK